jgi:hypothetical protein
MSSYASQDSFGSYEPPDQFEWLETDDIEAAQGGVTPDVTRGTTVETDPFSQQQTQLRPKKLGFCQPTDWDEEKIYDEDPPSFIHYSIEWKVKLHKKEVSNDTELDVVLAPASYWRLVLQPKLEKLLCRKLAKNRHVMSEETNVVISVTDRSQRDVTKRFDDTNVEWSVIERQLVLWSDLFQAGKKLRVNISFIYIETSLPAATSSRKADKRGASSTTNMMLDERAAQLDAEEASTGEPSIWKDVYSAMRCRSSSCNSKPHCWVDPVGKKHYKLRPTHLKSLIEHVARGHVLEGHDDVPKYVREQLYAEEEQKRQKSASTSAANSAPIHITNVLPAPSYSTPTSVSGTPAPGSISTPIPHLDIPRPRDKAVKDYCAWQQLQVEDPEQKAGYQKAYKVIMDDGMDLELIHQDPNPEFLIKGGVKRGAALHVVGDIEDWVKRCKRAETEE